MIPRKIEADKNQVELEKNSIRSRRIFLPCYICKHKFFYLNVFYNVADSCIYNFCLVLLLFYKSMQNRKKTFGIDINYNWVSSHFFRFRFVRRNSPTLEKFFKKNFQLNYGLPYFGKNWLDFLTTLA